MPDLTALFEAPAGLAPLYLHLSVTDPETVAALSDAAVTAPSQSVRSSRTPARAYLSTIVSAGCPNGFASPTETTATRGATAARKPSVEDVLLPWWGTFRMSTRRSPPRERC